MWHIFTMKYYKALKNKIIKFLCKWKELETIVMIKITKA